MKQFIAAILFVLGSALISTASFAVVDVDAPIIKVRASCVAIDNCFENMTDVSSWIGNVRTPKTSASAPLLVDIGPGDFSGLFMLCFGNPDYDYITFRGAGIEKTRIGRITIGQGCEEVSFSDLTIVQQAGSSYAIVLTQSGSTTRWNNVLLDGNWDEYGGGCVAQGRHTWVSSQVRGNYKIRCDKSWFLGSELIGKMGFGAGSKYTMTVLEVRANGEAHVYGSNISAVYDDTAFIPGLIAEYHRAVYAENDGEIHIHGTGIDVMSDTVSDIAALEVGVGGKIHATETGYNMRTGSGGTITRLINNGGTIKAPYQWEEGDAPPNITSITGADTVVDTSGPAPRLLVYNSNCTGANGAWSDIATGNCI